MAKTYRERITERVIEREVVEDYIDVRLPTKIKFNNGDFITVFQKALEFISIDLNLTKGAMKLLLYLIAKTELTNEIRLPIQTIAEVLKISKGNAYDFLNELKKHNIVIWEQKLKTLRLNYELGYKGKIKDFKKVQYKDSPILLEPSKNQLTIPLEIEQVEQKEKKDTPTLSKINRVIEWSQDKEWFNLDYINSIKENYQKTGKLSAAQKKGLENILIKANQ
jgi:hypothetical protein